MVNPGAETIVPGQRWLSESEPELGLGQIKEASGRQIVVWFVGGEIERRYVRGNAPLRRIRFREGDEVEAIDGSTFVVEHVEEREGLLFYHGEGDSLCEMLLSHHMRLDAPEERLGIGQWSPAGDFALRYKALQLRSTWMSAPTRGMIGARADLLPHQLYIAHEATKRQRPRLLLADETGLGKTIEAGLILHQLYHTERASRVLLLLPEPLLNQWFVEMLRRFHMIFRVLDEAHCHATEESDPQANPFLDDQLCICSLSWLAAHPKRAAQAYAASWDVMICDEAHHIESDTPEHDVVAALAANTWAVLLLTATPEQSGHKHHFARLQLLDPARYTDEEAFLHSHQRYQDLAEMAASLLATEETPLPQDVAQRIETDDPILWEAYQEHLQQTTPEEAIDDLLDRYGLGRVMFRNTRQRIQGFPKRIIRFHPLVPREQTTPLPLRKDPRLPWLLSFLAKHQTSAQSEEKILVMCDTKEMVIALHKQLQAELSLAIAIFHEGLSLLQRDRNAVYFSAPSSEGAIVMLCSAVGGEGRNFQAARHLLLFDLPTDPERLDQRIGRLDRIGQGASIEIHVPYIEGTAQEVQARWFDEGLNAFAAPQPGGHQTYQHMKDALEQCQRGFWLDQKQQTALATLLADTASYHSALRETLAAGRDKLLELSSFQPSQGEQLQTDVISLQQNPAHQRTICRLFEHFGVELDELAQATWKLQPGPALHEDFPWLKGDDMRATFDRSQALRHPTTQFLSLEHPMVQGAFSLLLDNPESSCCVGIAPDEDQAIWLEALFVWECTAPQSINIRRFVPPSPVCIAIDHQMSAHTAERDAPLGWSEEAMAQVQPASRRWLEHEALFEELLPTMLDKARELAESRQASQRDDFIVKARAQLQPEIDRLQHLQRHNSDVSSQEIELARDELTAIETHIAKSYLRLDALRVTICGMPQPG